MLRRGDSHLEARAPTVGAAPCTRLSIHGICALDKLIATHALALGVSLVTNSEADFQGYAGLPIDNWVNRH